MAPEPEFSSDVEVTVFDIDGVLADVGHRLHHIAHRPKDWSAFFAAADADPPLAEGVERARQAAGETAIVYLTGRPEGLRRVTQDWLDRHGLPPGPLVMRRRGDFRPARQAKVDLLREISRTAPVRALVDDDPAVVAAVRDAGFDVLHATWAPSARGSSQQPTLWEAQETEGRS